MEKNYNILKKYILYFIVFALVCLVGISNCFALTNNNAINFYDNNGSSLTSVSTNYIQQIDESSAIFTTTSNSYGGAVMIQASTPLILNHIYTLFINVGADSNGGFTELSTKNCVGLGTTYASAINSYVNCSITPKYSQKSGVTTDKGRGLYYSFIANTNGAYILLPYTTQYTCTNCNQYSFGFNLEDGGDTTGLTQQQVNNLISNQTTIIQNEISNMQQDISGSIDDMKDSINNNIDKNLNDCYTNKNIDDFKIGTITSNGSNFPNSYRLRTNYITILPSNEYKLILTSNYTMQTVVFEYDSNKKFIKRQPPGWGSLPFTFTTSEDTKYIRLIFRTSPEQLILGNEISDLTIEGSFCDSKLDQTKESIDKVNSTLTDTTPVDASSLGNTAGWLPPGPIDSIINLPQTFLLSLTTALGGTCVPLDVTIPYVNQHINIPCLSTIFSQINGLTTFWVWVGRIASVVILYRYLIALWDYYDRLTTMQANFRDDFGGGV